MTVMCLEHDGPCEDLHFLMIKHSLQANKML